MESASNIRSSVKNDHSSSTLSSLVKDQIGVEATVAVAEVPVQSSEGDNVIRKSANSSDGIEGDETKSTEASCGLNIEPETGISIDSSSLSQQSHSYIQSNDSTNLLEATEVIPVDPTSLLSFASSRLPLSLNDGLKGSQSVDSQQPRQELMVEVEQRTVLELQQEVPLSNSSFREGESQPDAYREVAAKDTLRAESTRKTSSSNGSSESDGSTDGEEADMSDAMKESPTSPFESEPEMKTSRDYISSPREDSSSAMMVVAHKESITSLDKKAASLEEEEMESLGGMVPSREGMITSHEEMITSSDIRYPSSGGQTESEPEIVPSPPSGEDRIMTTSQVSSSQRFSDCEILSATELAEYEKSSPEGQPAADSDEDIAKPSSIKVSTYVSSYTEGFLPLIEGVTSAFGEALQPEADTQPPSTFPNAEAVESQSQFAAVSSTSALTSRLEFENEMLRSEIMSLNEEIQGAWHQAQLAKEERGYAKESAAASHKRTRECEEQMRGMAEEFAEERNRIADQYDQRLRDAERKLQESLNLLADVEMSLSAKDGQLAVLRVRLEEADAELEDTRQRCAASEEESRKTVADRESTVTTHVTALETLKAHSDRMQEELAIKTSDLERIRGEVFSLETGFAEEKESLASMVTSLQSQIAAEKSRSLSLQHQVNGSQNSLEGVRKELEEYRAKATRTLQSKDRLIASLQEDSGSSSSSPAALLELEDVKNERDLLREEVSSLLMQLESARMELAEAEAQSVQDRETLEDRLSSSTQDICDLKDKIETFSTDLATSKQELSFAHEQLHRDRIQFQEATLQQSAENDDLKRQIETQASSTASSADMEARLHALAENLITKQTTIESLTTEKTSLKLQLERLSTSTSNIANMGVGNRSSAVTIPVDDDRPDFNGAQTRVRLPLLFREAPDDTGVTRGVKRAATSLDALGIKIGVFFRRYPVARVFALVYAFVLHLWVFIVLLTYTPEMH